MGNVSSPSSSGSPCRCDVQTKNVEPIDQSEAPDEQFDLVIDLDPTVDSRENLEVVIEKLSNTYPALFKDREMPTHADLDEAIQFAMDLQIF